MAYLIKKLSMRLAYLLLFALMAAVPSGYASNAPPEPAEAYQDTEAAPESATMISKISSETGDQHALVRIAADGAIRDYSSFTLTDPPRIVYDLKNIRSPHATEKILAVDSPWMVEWTEERRTASAEKALLKRRCTPEDLAEVMVFLLAGAAMVTGQTVVVDGGLTLEAR